MFHSLIPSQICHKADYDAKSEHMWDEKHCIKRINKKSSDIEIGEYKEMRVSALLSRYRAIAPFTRILEMLARISAGTLAILTEVLS
jgi:hypothetical protein